MAHGTGDPCDPCDCRGDGWRGAPRDCRARPQRDPDMTARLAALDAEVRLLRELLDEVKANRDELRADRDGLRTDRDSLREQLLLLTDQRAAPADERPAWRRLFG